jgi:hypothetical protein
MSDTTQHTTRDTTRAHAPRIMLTQQQASFRFTFPAAVALANGGRLGGNWYGYYDTR